MKAQEIAMIRVIFDPAPDAGARTPSRACVSGSEI